MAARSFICPQLPLLRRYPEMATSTLPLGALVKLISDSSRGGRLALGLRMPGDQSGSWEVSRRSPCRATANKYALHFTVCQQRSTRYCGSLLGRTQDVDDCVSLWTCEMPDWSRCSRSFSARTTRRSLPSP